MWDFSLISSVKQSCESHKLDPVLTLTLTPVLVVVLVMVLALALVKFDSSRVDSIRVDSSRFKLIRFRCIRFWQSCVRLFVAMGSLNVFILIRFRIFHDVLINKKTEQRRRGRRPWPFELYALKRRYTSWSWCCGARNRGEHNCRWGK